MLERELTYTVPFDRLARVACSTQRKICGTCRVCLLASLLAGVAVVLSTFLNHAIVESLVEAGLSKAYAQVTSIAAIVGSFICLAASFNLTQRRCVATLTQRNPAIAPTRLRVDEVGLWFLMEPADYHVKWVGIDQIYLEPDGIVIISYGGLSYFIPDAAFDTTVKRNQFARWLYSQISQRAQERSSDDLKLVLGALDGAEKD